MRENLKDNKLYDEFVRRGLDAGFTDPQIDFLWEFMNRIGSQQGMMGGFNFNF